MSHVTWKLKPGFESLRKPRVLRVLEPAFRKGKEKKGFRLIAWSLQDNHIHLVVEGESTEEVARGRQGLGVSITKRLNKRWERVGQGSVFLDRHGKKPMKGFHHRRRGMGYVHGNAKRHGHVLPKGEPDRYSSAPWWPWCLQKFRRPLRSPPVAKSRYLHAEGVIVSLDLDHRPGFGEGSRLRLDFQRMCVVERSAELVG
jgi:REP element-mobilizing transposase RayT